MMSTVSEFLMSAEYILSHGNNGLILCERGIRRSFDEINYQVITLVKISVKGVRSKVL